MKLVLVCFSFLLTSWPCTKCQCQTKTGCKSSSISCLASLLCTQALPSSCCCFETLTHTRGYELLMTQWQCLVPCCCSGCCIHQWSFQIYIKLPCVGLRKSALRFTKGFKRETLIFLWFPVWVTKRSPKTELFGLFWTKPVTTEPGLQCYSRCYIRRTVTLIKCWILLDPSVAHFNILILTPRTLFIWLFWLK